VHTRARAVTSILTSVLTITYLSADGIAATSSAAKSSAIGVVTASGHFVLDRSEVWGNATLFDGGKIETGAASSEAALRNGVKIQLASASSATVGESQLTLTKGTGQVSATEDYQVTAGGLAIRSAVGASRVRVAWLAGGTVEVTALSGAARVANRTGLVLASIPAGRRMDFAIQAAAGVVTRTGCLLSKDGRFLLQDENTQEVLEIRGNDRDLAAQVGNRVTITGTASALRPALAAASGILNATTVAQRETGGCLSVAAALDAQTEITNPAGGSAPNQPAEAPAKAPAPAPKAGMSTGAKVAIIAVIGGGGAGAAIALAGKKGSTSP
jgi:hypothetical protein